MTPAEILSGLEEALREAGAPGFEFRLVDLEHWFEPCQGSPEVHRVPRGKEFGIWCILCRAAFIPPYMLQRATPDILKAAALVMLRQPTPEADHA